MTPLLYVDFPEVLSLLFCWAWLSHSGEQGRVKFFGVVQYITSRLVVFEPKSDGAAAHCGVSACRTVISKRCIAGLSCSDQFDSVVLFPEYAFVGSAEANPHELPLPFPPALLDRVS